MGVVYRAHDEATGRDVAIKALRGGARAGATQQRRFVREAQALARLHHPNIVRVHAVGEEQGTPYIVMDFVPGVPLSERLEEAPLEPKEAVALAVKLADALQSRVRCS